MTREPRRVTRSRLLRSAGAVVASVLVLALVHRLAGAVMFVVSMVMLTYAIRRRQV